MAHSEAAAVQNRQVRKATDYPTHAPIHAAGRPMDALTRITMESRFGCPLNQVRIHTDERAATMASAIGAKAYTIGKDIVFGRGRYRPNSQEGQELLAHELTHVLQQRAATLTSTAKSVSLATDPAAEREADYFAKEGNSGWGSRPSVSVRPPALYRKAEDEEATGTSVQTSAEGINHVDGFLAARVGLFTVLIWGNDYVAMLDRAANPWSDRYTPAALVAAAVAAVVRHVTANPPDVAQIDALRVELLRERRYHIRARMALGPSAIDPIFHAFIDRHAVGEIIVRLGVELSEQGRALEAEAELGEFFMQRLVEVVRNFGSVRPYLERNATLEAAELTSDHVFNMLSRLELRRSAAHLAKSHKVTRSLRGAPNADWTALTPEQWAGVLADIATQIVEASGRAALERQERERRHELNERLRPHRLSIADSARYILQTYDPDSRVTVNFLGPVDVEGGQVITNAQGQQLFILRAGYRVVYQNLSDHLFYVQSASGIEHELQYGVFALVAEKTKHIIPAVQFTMDIAAAIFPPVRLPYLAVNVLSVGSKFAVQWDELIRLAENVQIAKRAIDSLLPGALNKAIRGTASRGLSELFNPRHTTATPKQILLLAMRIISAAVRGSAAGRAAGETSKAAWAEIRKELRSFGGIIAQFRALASRELTDDVEKHIERLVEELSRLVGGEGRHYARLIRSMDEAQLERLVRESEELGTNGAALVSLIASCIAW